MSDLTAYRQRCANAAMNAWSMHAVVCDHSQTIPVGNLVDAVLAVHDQDAETLRSENEELRKRAEIAEGAIARARAEIAEHSECSDWCCDCMPSVLAALDDQEAGC